MHYLLYLRRSLLRRPKRHLSLFVILTCAFILPLLISIYRDSSAFGQRQQILYQTKGETFHIQNAREEDLELFENIPGLSEPRFEDGVICLHILSDEEWQDLYAMDDYSKAIRARFGEDGGSRMTVVGFDYDYVHGTSDASMGFEQLSLIILNLFIILISSLIVGSAYKSHIRRFSSDMGVLRSLGAEDRQIFLIFFIEFAIVFTLAALSAALISAGVMKLLFSAYLEVEGSEGFSWVIFKINPLNTLLHIAVFFIVLLAVILRTLLRFTRGSTVAAIREDIQESEITKNRKKLKFKKTPEKSLASLWLERTNRTHASCVFVAVPVMTVFLFLFGYLSLDADFVSQPPEYELWITKNSPEFGGFAQEDLDFIKSLPQVDSALCRRDAPEEIFNKSAGGLMIDQVRIKLISPDLHNEVEEILRKKFPGMEYEIHNFQAVAEEGAKMSKGIYFMLAFIFSAMFIFISIIIRMKLKDYISDSKKTVRTLSTLGAPDGAVISSYLRQSAVSAALATVIPVVLSVILLLLATIPAAIKPSFDLPFLAIYSAVSTMTVCTFILPIYNELKRYFKKKL